MQSLESSGCQLNDSPMIYSDPRQALVFALNMSSASPAGEVNCNPDPGPSATVKDHLSVSGNHLHILASETCTIPNPVHISPYSFALHMCPPPDNAPPSPKIAVYSIDIDGREEPARNTPLRALDGRGPEFGPVIMVYLAFRRCSSGSRDIDTHRGRRRDLLAVPLDRLSKDGTSAARWDRDPPLQLAHGFHQDLRNCHQWVIVQAITKGNGHISNVVGSLRCSWTLWMAKGCLFRHIAKTSRVIFKVQHIGTHLRHEQQQNPLA